MNLTEKAAFLGGFPLDNFQGAAGGVGMATPKDISKLASIDTRLNQAKSFAEYVITQLGSSGYKMLPDISRGDVLLDAFNRKDIGSSLTAEHLRDFRNKEIVNAACLVRSYIDGYYVGKEKSKDRYAEHCLIEVGKYLAYLELLYESGALWEDVMSRIVNARNRRCLRSGDSTPLDKECIQQAGRRLKGINPSKSKNKIAEEILQDPSIQERLSKKFSSRTIVRILKAADL
jgi:hypothetical protein